MTEPEMYKIAQAAVLNKWLTEKDSKGRSQESLYKELHEAWEKKNENATILGIFVEEVEKVIGELEVAKAKIRQPVVTAKKNIAGFAPYVAPAKAPETPELPDATGPEPHGIDLDWN